MSRKPIPATDRGIIRRAYLNAPIRDGKRFANAHRGRPRRTLTQRQLSLDWGVSQSTVARIIAEID